MFPPQVTRESVPQRTLRAAMYAKKTIEAGFTTIRDLGTGETLRRGRTLRAAVAWAAMAG